MRGVVLHDMLIPSRLVPSYSKCCHTSLNPDLGINDDMTFPVAHFKVICLSNDHVACLKSENAIMNNTIKYEN